MKRLRQVLRVGAIVHIVTGPLAMILLFVSGPWVIGEGRVQEFLRTLEGGDARVPVQVEVPIRSRFKTRIDLLDNLRTAEKELRKGVDQVMDDPRKVPPA